MTDDSLKKRGRSNYFHTQKRDASHERAHLFFCVIFRSKENDFPKIFVSLPSEPLKVTSL